MAILRNTDGFSTVLSTNPWGAFDRPDPTKWAVFFEDFVAYDKTQGNVAWTLTQTNGTDTITGATGIVNLTLGGADNDLAQLYLTDAPFQTTSGKKLFFEARVKVQKGASGTIGQEEVVVGLTSVQTGTAFMAADGLTRTFDDGLAFLSIDAETGITALQGENDVFTTESGEMTYADDTWMVLSIYYDGTNSYFYKDDVLVSTFTTNVATSVVTPMLYIKAGGAHAKVLLCDYIMVAVER